MRSWIGVLAAAGMVWCGGSCGCRNKDKVSRRQVGPSPETQLTVAQPSKAQRGAIARARNGAKKLARTLLGRLQEVLTRKGPEAALQVCAREAQQLTARIAKETAVRVGRSSLRLRNRANEPPTWVKKWLEAQGSRSVNSARGFARVDQTSAGTVARVLIPLGMKGPCVLCHGPRESMPARVRELVAKHYPQDRAVGYRPGDLRGALWAETPAPK